VRSNCVGNMHYHCYTDNTEVPPNYTVFFSPHDKPNRRGYRVYTRLYIYVLSRENNIGGGDGITSKTDCYYTIVITRPRVLLIIIGRNVIYCMHEASTTWARDLVHAETTHVPEAYNMFYFKRARGGVTER